MPTTNDLFEAPVDLEEAEKQQRELTLDVQTIQQQLGDRQRTDKNGNRLSRKDYWAWKKQAQFVLNQKLATLRSVKAWIREHRPTLNLSVAQQSTSHLRRLVEVLAALGEETDLEKDELEALEAAQLFLEQIS